MPTIWENLTHDNIFKTVEETLSAKLSNICLKRNSYINRVYELENFETFERFIVKFYRPNRWTREMIGEEHQFLNALSIKEIPVIPPIDIKGKTLFQFENISYAIFPKKGGRAIDEFDQEGWETIGRIIARVHLEGEGRKESKRIIWRPSIATAKHLDVLLESSFVLPDFKNKLKESVELFIKKADPFFEDTLMIMIHGDCHRGNLIHRALEGIYLVDFDDTCIGPPVQDLWMLLPDTVENSKREIEWFIKGYKTFKNFNYRSLKLIDYLRGMRLVHYAAWLAVQFTETDFQQHFPEAGTAKYWNGLIKEIQEIIYMEKEE